MGGKRKMLTKTRRATLRKELTEALVEGKFRLNDGQSLDDLLDSVDTGIRNDTYPIEVTVDGLLTAWFSGPALTEPAEAQTAAPDPSTQPGAAAPAPEPVYVAPAADGSQSQHANLEAAALAMSQGLDQMAVMQAAMTPAVDPNTPAQIDASPVEDWLNLLKMAKEKKTEIEAMEQMAKDNVAAYLDQEGGPDKSKIAYLNGKPVYRRTWVPKTSLSKDKLYADHPELQGAYEVTTHHYRSEFVG